MRIKGEMDALVDARVDASPVAVGKTSPIAVHVGKTFNTFEEVEKALKLLERDYYHPLRRFNSQTVREYNKRREKAGSELRVAKQLKFAFVLYR